MENVRIALVHDWLTGRRGGEKVLEVLAELFPRAPIFTLIRFPGSQVQELEARDIRTSFLQGMPFLRKRYRSYLPLYPLAVEQFDLQEFELVLSSSHCVAKGIIPGPEALHVSYIHSPVRYAWNQYFAYFGPGRTGPIGRFLIPPLLHRLRVWDVTSAARVDHFLANSKAVARRIEKYYRRPAEVVHPPVDTDFFTPPESEPERRGFLIVSALVPYKRIDAAAAAFRGRRDELRVVGDGPEYKALRRAAGPNVAFLGAVDDGELRRLYREAAAFLQPGEEDFGIAPLEAQACGTPVIAYGRGGACETVLPGETGLLYDAPTPAALAAALDKFRGLAFNTHSLRSHALKFSRGVFKEKIAARLRRLWDGHKDSR
ncbi:MAG: glycosyltransferase family 4 protein [Candidatus Aminicenantes bacterium]|nr:glycosyltransferase family 4 protein [Candidatus Aminicenantes bacterium]